MGLLVVEPSDRHLQLRVHIKGCSGSTMQSGEKRQATGKHGMLELKKQSRPASGIVGAQIPTPLTVQVVINPSTDALANVL